MNRSHAQIAAEYSAHARRLRAFGEEAPNYESQRSYFQSSREYQDASARYYRADRIVRGVEEDT